VSDSLGSDQANVKQADTESSAEDPKKQIQTRLGQQLHAARKRKDITIADASSRLRLHEAYLEGLESGDWSKLPEEVYVLGFLRQYAAFLDEDIREDITALKSGGYRLTKPLTIPDPAIAPNKTWAIAAGILFVLLFILFNAVGDGEKKISPPEARLADTNPITTERVTTTKQTVSEAMPTMPASPPAPPRAAPSVAGTPAAANANIKALPLMEKETASPAAASKVLSTMHRYRLTAIRASAWLQVYNPSGTLLKEALLHAGQSLWLESDAPFLSVTCGNAAALRIEVDGALYAAAGTLGAAKKVLRDFRIEAPSPKR